MAHTALLEVVEHESSLRIMWSTTLDELETSFGASMRISGRGRRTMGHVCNNQMMDVKMAIRMANANGTFQLLLPSWVGGSLKSNAGCPMVVECQSPSLSRKGR